MSSSCFNLNFMTWRSDLNRFQDTVEISIGLMILSQPHKLEMMPDLSTLLFHFGRVSQLLFVLEMSMYGKIKLSHSISRR